MQLKHCAAVLACLLLALAGSCSGTDKELPPAEQPTIDIEQQLRELESLPLPEGVEPALWGQLKQEMEKLLTARGKAVLAAPAADASAVSLSIEGTEASWLYVSQGDYDQNGEVNISDITPIALHFGESNGGDPFAESTVQSVVDGDGNGEINITDLTPIGINFGARVGSYNIYASPAAQDYPGSNTGPNGDGAELVDIVAFSTASGDPSAVRLSFTRQLSEPLPAGFIWLRPCDTPGGEGLLGTAGNLFDLSSLNQPPLARLTSPTIPIYELPPALQIFYVTGSSDPDGTIVNYEFDFDGDGSFDQSFGSEPELVEYLYTEAGLYRASLRVTDDDGAQSSAELQISVNSLVNLPPTANLTRDPSEGEVPLTVNFDASASTDSDGSIVSYDWDLDADGVYEVLGASDPTISHTYTDAGFLFAAVRVTDDFGAQAFTSQSIDATDAGNLLPLADLSSDVSSGQRPLLVSFDASGSFDTDGTIVEYRWDLGGDGETDITSSEPFLQFTFHKEGEQIVQVFAVDNDGGVSAPDSVELELTQGWEVRNIAINRFPVRTDMVVVDVGGQDFEPIIAYSENGNNSGQLTVIRGINQATTFDFGGTLVHEATEDFDMEVVQGFPAIAIHTNGLVYTRAQNAEGSAWSQPVDIDNSFGSGSFGLDLEIVSGNPAVTYNNVQNPTQFIRASDELGGSWSGGTLTGIDFNGHQPLLIVSDGKPSVIANNYDSGDIMFFAGQDAVGSGFAALQDVVAGYGLTRQFSSSVLNGVPALAFTQFGRVYFLTAKNAAGSQWNSPQLLLDMTNEGVYFVTPVLRSISGLPAIALNSNRSQVWYMEAEDAQGQVWKDPELVDADEAGGSGLEMVSYLGRPALSYCRNNSGRVRFAYLRE